MQKSILAMVLHFKMCWESLGGSCVFVCLFFEVKLT